MSARNHFKYIDFDKHNILRRKRTNFWKYTPEIGVPIYSFGSKGLCEYLNTTNRKGFVKCDLEFDKSTFPQNVVFILSDNGDYEIV